MNLSRQFAYFLVVGTIVIVAAEFGQFDAVAIVLGVSATPGQMRVKLRGEHFDPVFRQTLYRLQLHTGSKNWFKINLGLKSC